MLDIRWLQLQTFFRIIVISPGQPGEMVTGV